MLPHYQHFNHCPRCGAGARSSPARAARRRQEATIPFHDMPESLVDGLGRARFFATVLDGSPVLVRTREGRPILVTPNPKDASGRGTSLRHHAALMDLYDPDRAQGPLSVRRGQGATVASSWAAVGAEVVARLKAERDGVVLLTGPVTSPSLRAAIAEIAAHAGLRHVAYAPIESSAASRAWKAAFGDGRLGRTFERERQADTLRALMLAPADRPAIYAGKLAGMLLLMGLVELVLVPLVGLLFQAPVFAHPLLLAGLLIAGTTGFAAVGTLFAAMLVRARSRDVMLPICCIQSRFRS